MDGVDSLDPLVGVVRACAALGVNRARVYRVRERRRHLAGAQVRRGPRPRPPLALSRAEREALLEVLNSERFADRAPASIHATLLDEGQYLGSVRTLYRLLAFPIRASPIARLVSPVISRFPHMEPAHLPGSTTSPGWLGARVRAPRHMAFRSENGVGTRK